MAEETLTDPAAELLDLCRLFQQHNAPRKATFNALAEVYDVTADSADFHALNAAISRRFESLGNAVASDGSMPRNIKEGSVETIKTLSSFLNSQSLPKAWDDVTKVAFRPEHMTALEYLSALIRNRIPLRQLSAQERERISGDIRDVLLDLRSGEMIIYPIAAAVIIEAFETLLLTLEKFPFFGHALLGERIALASVAVSTAEHRIQLNTATDAPRPAVFGKACKVLGTLAALYVLPHEISEATDKYLDWSREVAAFISSVAPPAVKALPPPNKEPNRQ